MKPTQEQVIAWAREAGFKVYDEDRFMNTHISDTLVHIHTAAENLAALAYEAGRADENEACAKVADAQLFNSQYLASNPPQSAAAWSIAKAIRARREQ